MRAFRRGAVALIRAWALAGGLVLLFIVGLTVWNVGTYLLDDLLSPLGVSVAPLGGYEELVRLFVGAGAIMLFPYCQLRRGHVAVELFVDRFPLPLQRFIDGVATLLMAALALFLCYWTVGGMLETRSDNVISLVLGWPEWPFYIPVIISLLLWALAALLVLGETQSLADSPEEQP